MDSDQLDLVQKYTRASTERLVFFESVLAGLDHNNIEGDVVECGVWKGGHIILARMTSPRRTCWLYDTFDGMTEPSEHDFKNGDARKTAKAVFQRKGDGVKWLACSYEEVVDNLVATGTMDRELLRFIVGDVRQTLLDGSLLPDRIALLRLDTDWYDSTKIELEKLYPRLVPGGVLIVDDYGHWAGAKKAVNEYFMGQLINFHRIDYTAIMVVK